MGEPPRRAPEWLSRHRPRNGLLRAIAVAFQGAEVAMLRDLLKPNGTG
jgi:hypothetical protein